MGLDPIWVKLDPMPKGLFYHSRIEKWTIIKLFERQVTPQYHLVSTTKTGITQKLSIIRVYEHKSTSFAGETISMNHSILSGQTCTTNNTLVAEVHIFENLQ